MNSNFNLHSYSTEKQVLKTRDSEPETLKSELTSLTERLRDLESAKERIESFLQEELREKTEAMRTKDSVIKELEQKINRKVPLESQLSEKQELLKIRDAELKAIKSEVTSLKTRLSELASAKERTESFLQQELRKRTEALRAKHPAIKEFEKGSNRKLEDLERKLHQTEELLKARDAELETLRSEANALSKQLTELQSVAEQKERSLQAELEKTKEMLVAKDATIEGLEQKLARAAELESQLQEQQKLLKARDAEIAALRSEAIALTVRLAELGSAEAQKESFLHEQLRRTKEALRAKEWAMKALEEKLDQRVNTLQSQLIDKEKFLQIRNEEVAKLAADLKEKKLVLAKQEIADFQSMKRRNIWKRRFARLHLPEKSN